MKKTQEINTKIIHRRLMTAEFVKKITPICQLEQKPIMTVGVENNSYRILSPWCLPFHHTGICFNTVPPRRPPVKICAEAAFLL